MTKNTMKVETQIHLNRFKWNNIKDKVPYDKQLCCILIWGHGDPKLCMASYNKEKLSFVLIQHQASTIFSNNYISYWADWSDFDKFIGIPEIHGCE